MKASEVLAGARDVLAERGWRQGFREKESSAHCVLEAMACAAQGHPAYVRAEKIFKSLVGPAPTEWQDAPERTVEDVVLMLKHAEELALEREAS